MTRINITDDMIERLARCEYEEDWGGGSWEDAPDGSKRLRLDIARAHLQAALNRRTGPKDRRVEWDDTYQVLNRRCHPYAGRRKDGADYVLLPRKSDRLKREAEAKAQEIHVSEEMEVAGALAYYGTRSVITTPGELDKFSRTYRAMRLQEIKERGQ